MTTTSTPLSLPAGYPRRFEERVTLRDGRSVFIRPVVPGDAEELGFELEHADPQTLYHRFFRPSITVDSELLTRLTVLDYDRRFALGAFADSGVALARYEGSAGSDVADVAVAVKPAWRRVGLATILLSRLEEAALERGIRQFRADFLAENAAVGALVSAAGYGTPRYDLGVASVEIDLADRHGSRSR